MLLLPSPKREWLLRTTITGLEKSWRACICSNVVVRVKTFIQILMAVLSLGVSSPLPVCAAGMPETGMPCCCAVSSSCKCHSDEPCKTSCEVSQAQAFDKQLPARTAFKPFHNGCGLLFSIAPVTIKYLVPAPVVSRRDSDASPPFCGGPPQAILRLWLI